MKSRQLLANRDAERMAYVSMRNQTQYAPHPQRRPRRGTPSIELSGPLHPLDQISLYARQHRPLTERDRQRARNKGVAEYKRSVKREDRELRRQADPAVKGAPTPKNPRPPRRHLMGV